MIVVMTEDRIGIRHMLEVMKMHSESPKVVLVGLEEAMELEASHVIKLHLQKFLEVSMPTWTKAPRFQDLEPWQRRGKRKGQRPR